jgi:hypothetical protein
MHPGGRAQNIGTNRDLIFGAGDIPSEYTNTIPTARKTKGLPNGKPLFNLAEAQRFELWNPFGSPVFKTGAFNRSATLPE